MMGCSCWKDWCFFHQKNKCAHAPAYIFIKNKIIKWITIICIDHKWQLQDSALLTLIKVLPNASSCQGAISVSGSQDKICFTRLSFDHSRYTAPLHHLFIPEVMMLSFIIKPISRLVHVLLTLICLLQNLLGRTKKKSACHQVYHVAVTL